MLVYRCLLQTHNDFLISSYYLWVNLPHLLFFVPVGYRSVIDLHHRSSPTLDMWPVHSSIRYSIEFLIPRSTIIYFPPFFREWNMNSPINFPILSTTDAEEIKRIKWLHIIILNFFVWMYFVVLTAFRTFSITAYVADDIDSTIFIIFNNFFPQ